MDAKQIISNWLAQQPQNREIVYMRPSDEYPKLGCHYKSIAGGYFKFPKDAHWLSYWL